MTRKEYYRNYFQQNKERLIRAKRDRRQAIKPKRLSSIDWLRDYLGLKPLP